MYNVRKCKVTEMQSNGMNCMQRYLNDPKLFLVAGCVATLCFT